MNDQHDLQDLVIVVKKLWEDGSPVASYDEERQHETALLALRRWHNYDRRLKHNASTHEQRIEDLAKGLRDAFEPDRKLIGPLMTDYRHLARTLAEVLVSYRSCN